MRNKFLDANRYQKITIAIISCLFLILSPVTKSQKLEEIIVTAQKRAESLQDVSVSVTALDGEKLSDFGVARLEEITAYIPNFVMSETAIGTTMYIRGVGSGINQGFEQSVGMYRDGIYYGRAQLARAPIFDVERVEVLRGPQVTLFGNNSIGGAINITTAAPTKYFESSISALKDINHGELEKTFYVSGPITEDISARLSIRDYGMDGYLDNLTLNEKEPYRDFLTTRLKFKFEPSNFEFMNMELTLEQSDFDVKGRQIVIIEDEPSLGYATSTTNYVSGAMTGQTLGEIFSDFLRVGGNTVVGDDFESRYSNKDYSFNEIESVTLTTNIFLGDYELQIINGLLEYNYNDACDCDFTGADLIQYESDEDYKQTSHEIRITSPSNDLYEFTAGLYYQEDELAFNDALIAERDSALQDFIAGTFGGNFGVDLTDISGPRNFLQDSKLYSAFSQFTLIPTEDIRIIAGLRRSKTDKSAFRKLTYRQMDRITPIQDKPNPSDPLWLNGDDLFKKIADAFNIGLLVAPHYEEGSRSVWKNSYSLILEWDFSEDIMAYASRTRGFKSGGYDVRSNSPTDPSKIITNDGSFSTASPFSNFVPGTFEFDDEETLAHEIGIKTSINDIAEINFVYFYNEISNLQVSVFDGGVGFNVTNAASALSQGIEIDGRMLLSEQFMLSGSLAWMDFEFLDYEDGVCTASDRLAIDNLSGNPIVTEVLSVDPGADGWIGDEPGAPPVEVVVVNGQVQLNSPYIDNITTQLTSLEGTNCTLLQQTGVGPLYTADLTGKTNQYVSSYSGSLSLNFSDEINNNSHFLKAALDLNFAGPFHPTQNLDESVKQDGYQIFNFRLGVSDLDGMWELALIGRNIFDEKVIAYGNDVPLSSSQFGTVTKFGFLQRTKSWGIQARYNLY